MKIVTYSILIWILSGCATTKTVTIVHPPVGDFSKYQTATLVQKLDRGIEKKSLTSVLDKKLSALLKRKQLFSKISDTGALTIQSTFKKFDEANTGAISLSQPNSEVVVDCVFIDTKTNKEIAMIQVMGNSKNASRSSVGGGGISVSLTDADDLTEAAIEQAAEGIVEFMVAQKK